MAMLAEFDFRVLASVNAVLNGLAFVLVVAGLIAIKRGAERLHKVLMLSATTVSALFLVSYLIYHLNGEPVKFQRDGAIRVVYLLILASHVILAAVQVPLILMTVWFGLKDHRPRHRPLAKITAPIWLYVSITGVIVYLLLYQL